tara:strand:+ start:303 stop:761 length:459 start_codon:yes stop_codon:yes gene_type:complete
MKFFFVILLLVFACCHGSSVNMKDVPTSIKINDKWVLPRGGTMERLLAKGYKIDPNRPSVLIPDPNHPKYNDLVLSFKPKYTPSRGFKEKFQSGNLTLMSISGEVYRLERPFVWIYANGTYFKIQNNKTILVSSHKSLKGSPFDSYEFLKIK